MNASQDKEKEDSMIVSGMTMKNGKLHKDTLFLEDDNAREFEYPLSSLKMTIAMKP